MNSYQQKYIKISYGYQKKSTPSLYNVQKKNTSLKKTGADISKIRRRKSPQEILIPPCGTGWGIEIV
jgi:hypothetical protein